MSDRQFPYEHLPERIDWEKIGAYALAFVLLFLAFYLT